MINTQGKLFISAFIIVILGVTLIQSIADDVELAKTSSYSISNESVTLSAVSGTVANETLILQNSTVQNETGNLTNDQLLSIIEIRNTTSEIITSFCNVTLKTGYVACNDTGDNQLGPVYLEYTFIGSRSGSTVQDELVSLDALRNVTSEDITGFCNMTLATGDLVCNNTKNTTCFADYTYEPDTYVSNSAARTLLTITVLFFALAILVVAIGYAWAALKNSGVL